MNKKILAAVSAIILIVPITANAAPIRNNTVSQPTIAILDTALDTSLPIFNGRIVHEACVTEWSACPNGQAEMEGPGSAVMPINLMSRNGFEHGTQMASLAVSTNPNVKIVFVRIIGANTAGLRQNNSEKTIYNALDWVLRNKDKFNIQAVAMAQGHHSLLPGSDYCPKTPITESKINSLVGAGIPVFLPAGNYRDYSRISWPACIPSSIAVGATMPTKSVAIYSNYDYQLTDFFALGTTRATTVGGKLVNVAGTSASAIIAATQWATVKNAKPYLTYSQVYDLLSRTATPTKNSKVTGGKLINLEAALNG